MVLPLLPSELAPGELVLIQVSIGAPAELIAELVEPVSPEERERAARFTRPVDALRHRLGRGVVRHALARLLGAPAESFRIGTESVAGKPCLPGGPAFNVSHSGDVVLVAMAADGRVGVDVEAVRVIHDLEGVARVSFGADEVDALLQYTTGPARVAAFFRGWARKEAMLKGLGHGLGSLDRISISLAEGDGNALTRLDVAGETLAEWTVRTIQTTPLHEAAFAWDRPVREIRRVIA